MPTKFIPLGGSIRGNDITDSAIEKIQNFVPVLETPVIGGKNQLRMIKRRGYQSRLSTANITAGLQWSGVPGSGTSPATFRGVIVYTSITGSAIDLLQYDTSETTLGTIAVSPLRCIGIQETLISGVANLTLNVNSGTAQALYFFPNGGALTQVVDADFPATTVGRGVHLGGYYFMASTDGYIYNSDLNSLSSWSGSKIAVQMEPDSLVGLARLGKLIVALGTKTIEFYENSGLNSSGSPLSLVGRTVKFGCINGISIQEVDDSLMFISVAPDGIGVHILDGSGATKKVSNVFVDAILNKDLSSTIINSMFSGRPSLGGIVRQHGTTGVFLSTVGNPPGPLIYYPRFDLWTKHELSNAGNSSTAKVFNSGGDMFITTATGSGLLWSDPSATTTTSGKDYSALNFDALIQTVPMNDGTAKRKFYRSARLIGDQQAVTTPVVLSFSDDDGVNFTTAGTFEMSAFPMAPITRLGSSRKRIWKLSNSSAGGCALDGLEIEYDVAAA